MARTLSYPTSEGPWLLRRGVRNRTESPIRKKSKRKILSDRFS
jgi:hypothetical protein